MRTGQQRLASQGQQHHLEPGNRLRHRDQRDAAGQGHPGDVHPVHLLPDR
ncbi:hypothetical protein [Pseudomonas sp. FW300-N1A1]